MKRRGYVFISPYFTLSLFAWIKKSCVWSSKLFVSFLYLYILEKKVLVIVSL